MLCATNPPEHDSMVPMVCLLAFSIVPIISAIPWSPLNHTFPISSFIFSKLVSISVINSTSLRKIDLPDNLSLTKLR